MRNEDVARPRFAHDDGVAAIRQEECGNVVPFAALIVRPAQALVDVGSEEMIADGVHGLGIPPAMVAHGLAPAAAVKIVPAVGALDDPSVPVIPLLHRRVFQAVLGIPWADLCRTPDILGKHADDGRGLEIIDEGLAVGGSGLAACGRGEGGSHNQRKDCAKQSERIHLHRDGDTVRQWIGKLDRECPCRINYRGASEPRF